MQLADGGYLGKVQRPTSNDPYTVTSLIRADEKDGGATVNKLRVAGQDYPPGCSRNTAATRSPRGRSRRTRRATCSTGSRPRRATTRTTSRPDGQHLSRTAPIHYDTNVQDFRCDLSIVDCFAMNKHGYCEYYASTMAMMLRELDIPARLVEGFLPGKRIGQSNR